MYIDILTMYQLPFLAMCFSKDFNPYSKGERHKESEIVQIFESLQPEFPRPPRAFWTLEARLACITLYMFIQIIQIYNIPYTIYRSS